MKFPKMNGWTVGGLIFAILGAASTFIGKKQDENEALEKKYGKEENEEDD